MDKQLNHNLDNILKPDSSRLQKKQLKDFLHSSKPSKIKNFFHLREFSNIESSSQQPNYRSKSLSKAPKFDELLSIYSLKEKKKIFQDESDNNITSNMLPKINLKPPSLSYWQQEKNSRFNENLKKFSTVTKSFLLANNYNASSVRGKEEVFLGTRKNNMMTYLKHYQPQTLEQALKNEKRKKYEENERQLSESKKQTQQHKGKLILNTFKKKKMDKMKNSSTDWKNNFLIINNPLTEPKKIIL